MRRSSRLRGAAKFSRIVLSNLLLITLFLALASAVLASNPWYVDGVNGNDNNDCKTPQTACKTIGHAISLAASGDSITVAPAKYKENLSIGFSLTISGSRAARTIIDGQLIGTALWIAPKARVTLSNVTIQHGYAANGGGVFNNGTLTINNSTLSSNYAVSIIYGGTGAGIFNNGILTVNNSRLSDNSAEGGEKGDHSSAGGIENVAYGKLTINNSTLSGNSAYFGGGILNYGPATINSSTLSGNYSNGKNGSGDGAGIWNDGQVSKLRINNSTLSGNSAPSGAGGILGTATLQNSIVANNTGVNCDGTMTSNGYNLSSDGTCRFHGKGDLNKTNPLLGPLQNNGGPTPTEALLNGSPAIDAGNPSGCTDGNGHLLKTDQRGYPRPDREDSGGCDVGAYEKQSD
jgi:hypothetical protein